MNISDSHTGRDFNDVVFLHSSKLSLWQHEYKYRKVASSNTSHLEAHDDFFRLLMKGFFDPYVL